MTADSILGKAPLIAFAAVMDFAQAREFYESVLGLTLLRDETPFALVFSANGVMLRLTKFEGLRPQPFTILGWSVNDIEDTVQRLNANGVEFLRFPGLNQDAPLGIWNSPSGARIAWFQDPDGNVLSVTEFPQRSA